MLPYMRMARELVSGIMCTELTWEVLRAARRDARGKHCTLA